MADYRYLRRRRGRWLVQVRVPDDIKGCFNTTHVERYLKTSSLSEARRLKHAALAEIFERFDRARERKPLTENERKTEGAAEAHRIFEWLKANPYDGAQRLQEDYLAPLMSPDGEDIELEALKPRAKAIIERIGATPTEESIRALAEELINAAFHAQHIWLRGGTPPPPVKNARRAPAQSGAQHILQAGETYLTERQRDPRAKMTEQTVAQSRVTFRLFSDHMNGGPLSSVTRADAVSFLDALGKLHRHYGRRPGAASTPLRELLKKFPATPGQGLTNRTLNRHQSTLKKFFSWCQKRELFEGENPFADLARPKAPLSKTTWLPFTVEELNALFAGQKFETKPKKHNLPSALPWIMAISLFGGLRQGEICELAVEDIKRQSGVWFFDITAAKSEAGVRRVPIHSRLIKLGLLDYVKAIKSGPLFPGLTPGGHDRKRAHNVAKHFPQFKRDRGVNRERTVFHSFRKNFTRALEIAKVDADRAGQIVGHERGFTYRVYNPEGVDLPALRKVVEAVRYPGLKLPL